MLASFISDLGQKRLELMIPLLPLNFNGRWDAPNFHPNTQIVLLCVKAMTFLIIGGEIRVVDLRYVTLGYSCAQKFTYPLPKLCFFLFSK